MEKSILLTSWPCSATPVLGMLEPGLVISGPLRGAMSTSVLPRQTLCPDGSACGPSAHLPCRHPQHPSCQWTGLAGLGFLCLLLSMEVALYRGLCPAALNEPFDQGARDHLGLWVKVMVQAGTDPWLFPSTPTAWTTEQLYACLHVCFLLFLIFLHIYCDTINRQKIQDF